MFIAVHAAVGAVLGSVVDKPLPAFTLGFVSHFFVDMIPHGDENVYHAYKSGKKVNQAYWYLAFDVMLTVFLTSLFFLKVNFGAPITVLWGVIGSVLPDVIVGLAELIAQRRRNWFTRVLAKFHGYHWKNHHRLIRRIRKFERDIPLRYGFMLQVLTLGILVEKILR